jgi:hypothetical protein
LSAAAGAAAGGHAATATRQSIEVERSRPSLAEGSRGPRGADGSLTSMAIGRSRQGRHWANEGVALPGIRTLRRRLPIEHNASTFAGPPVTLATPA